MFRMKERNVIIHCHLSKNAGTTFDSSLKRTFGSKFIDHRDDNSMREGGSYLLHFLSLNLNIQALSSHHTPLTLPHIESIELLPAIFLRHPIDRIGSVCEFERKQDAQTPGAVNAKRLSFPE